MASAPVRSRCSKCWAAVSVPDGVARLACPACGRQADVVGRVEPAYGTPQIAPPSTRSYAAVWIVHGFVLVLLGGAAVGFRLGFGASTLGLALVAACGLAGLGTVGSAIREFLAVARHNRVARSEHVAKARIERIDAETDSEGSTTYTLVLKVGEGPEASVSMDGSPDGALQWLEPGRVVPVRFDPRDPRYLVVDWGVVAAGP